MKHIQVFDEEKGRWVLRAVEEVPDAPAAEPQRYWATVNFAAAEADIYRREMERLQALHWARARPAAYVPVLQTHDDIYFTNTARYNGDTYTTVANHVTNATAGYGATYANTPVRPTRPTRDTVARLVQQAYFPGSGEAPEDTEPRENQHERRAREYLEGRRRARRRR